ncbi:MAG: eukaryotic-like serine/threonine-protein kinase, partial [Pseudonocardiales bacterium]|nr:eukaryotic-like serine/threonine-protein kinase [Pseudonocardiales bacterium]
MKYLRSRFVNELSDFAPKRKSSVRPVAVKLFRFDAPAAELRRRVDIEIRTLAGLRHPGLVTVFDAGTVAEHAGEAAPFIVMELISGPTLAQRLNEGPFPTGHVALLGAELAGTL